MYTIPSHQVLLFKGWGLCSAPLGFWRPLLPRGCPSLPHPSPGQYGEVVPLLATRSNFWSTASTEEVPAQSGGTAEQCVDLGDV